MGLWLAVTPKVKFYALVALAFVLGLLRWRSVSVSNALARAEAKRLEMHVEAMRAAKEVENEIEVLDDVGLAARASKWLRNTSK